MCLNLIDLPYNTSKINKYVHSFFQKHPERGLCDSYLMTDMVGGIICRWFFYSCSPCGAAYFPFPLTLSLDMGFVLTSEMWAEGTGFQFGAKALKGIIYHFFSILESLPFTTGKTFSTKLLGLFSLSWDNRIVNLKPGAWSWAHLRCSWPTDSWITDKCSLLISTEILGLFITHYCNTNLTIKANSPSFRCFPFMKWKQWYLLLAGLGSLELLAPWVSKKIVCKILSTVPGIYSKCFINGSSTIIISINTTTRFIHWVLFNDNGIHTLQLVLE